MANKTHIGGLKPLSDDKRDLHLGQLINWPKLKELPVAYVVQPLSIKNQIADENDDYCAACAGAGMTEPKEEVVLFYPYLFAAAKFESGDDPDSWGLSFREVGKALRKWGIPEAKDVPEEIRKLPPEARRRFENYPEEVRQAARKHAAKSFFFVENGPYDAYDNARAAMWLFRDKKQQIMAGVEWGWSIEDYELAGTPEGFGHALWMSGWNKGALVINSAGEKAGRGGAHLETRETFNAYAKRFGLMMVVDMTPEEARAFIEAGAKINQAKLIQKLLLLLNRLFSFIKAKPDYKPTDEVPPEEPVAPPEPPKPSMRELIHLEARKWLGKDASPANQAPQELACVESVCYILRQAGVEIPVLISTIAFSRWLRSSEKFRLTTEPLPGNIILSVTGTGNGRIANGHTGIFGEAGRIMSNDSNVGMWLENYSIDSWVKRFRTEGGMRLYYFEAI